MNIITVVKKSLLFLLFLCTFNQSAGSVQTAPQTQPNKIDIAQELTVLGELTSLKLSNPVLLLVLFHFVKLFIHECGHGFVAEALDPGSFKGIDFLANSQTMNDLANHRGNHKPMVKLGKVNLYCNGILAVWQRDWSKIDWESEKGRRNILISKLAGPLTGVALCNLILYTINICTQYSKEKKLLVSAKKGFLNLYSPFQTILTTEQLSFQSKRFLINLSFIISLFLIEEIFYGFLPNKYGLSGLMTGGSGDGIELWRDIIFQKNHKSLLHNMSIGCAVVEWSCYGYLLHKYRTALDDLSLLSAKISDGVTL